MLLYVMIKAISGGENMADNRLAFDKITDIFDKWRCRYSQELFDYIVKECELDKSKSRINI